MGLLIKKSDFIGRVALSQSIQDTIDAYIDEFEEKYLIELLGAELFKLFKADVVAYAPVTPIYQTIFNPILEDNTIGSFYDLYYRNRGAIVRSRGMKPMLLGFIWFEYVIGTKFKHTGTGVVVDVNEVSRDADFTEGYIYQRYNEAVKDFGDIQRYIYQNNGDYPKFNGIQKQLAWKQ